MSCCSSVRAITTSPTLHARARPPATPVSSSARTSRPSSSTAAVVAAATLPMPDSTSSDLVPIDAAEVAFAAGAALDARALQQRQQRTQFLVHGADDGDSAHGTGDAATNNGPMIAPGQLQRCRARYFGCVAQLAAQDLAHRRLRQLGAELDRSCGRL